MPLPELLERLLTTPGPSGQERAAARRLAGGGCPGRRGLVRRPRQLVGARAGHGGRAVARTSSATSTRSASSSRISATTGSPPSRRVGGWDPHVMVGQRVDVLTRDGPLPGVVGARAEEAEAGATTASRSSSTISSSTSARRTATSCESSSVPATQRHLARRRRSRCTATASPRARSTTGSAATSRSRSRAGGWPSGRRARRRRSRVAAVQEEVGDFAGSRTAAFAIEPARRDRGRRHARDRRARRRSGGRGQGRARRRRRRSSRGPSIHPRVFELLLRDGGGGEDPVRGRGLARRDEHRRGRRLPQPRGRRRPASSPCRCATCTRRSRSARRRRATLERRACSSIVRRSRAGSSLALDASRG